MATLAEQIIESTQIKTKNFILGANYKLDMGSILACYGRSCPDNTDNSNQMSLGYEHTLSKRTFLYVDGYKRRAPSVADLNAFELGIHHSF